jgi:hypothetical protein
MEEIPVKRLFYLMSLLILAVTLTACGEQQKAPEVTQPAAQPAAQPAPAPGAPPAASPAMTGKAAETINAAGYTYVQVDTGKEKIWVAGPATQVKTGDSVAVPEGMVLNNFQSKSLNRTFDTIYFVPSLLVNGAAPAAQAMNMPEGHPPTGGMGDKMAMPNSGGAPKIAAPANIDLKGIAKADQTVADIYTRKAELAGKTVKVRGKVVKFSPEIMGKNWLHLQDGSGKNGTNDLTVTTTATAQPGDTVLVSGKLSVAKDFGYGYKYDVIVEDAQVTKE